MPIKVREYMHKAIRTGKPIKRSHDSKSDNSTDDKDLKEYPNTHEIISPNSPVSFFSPYSEPVDLILHTESYEEKEIETESRIKKCAGKLVSY